MAPAANLPEADMSLVQQMDVLQTYWLLFQHMKEDFVHKEDLKAILTSNVLAGAAPPPDHILKGTATFPNIATDVVARSKALVYDKLAKTGGAATENAIKGLEALTS
jgi:hypothetical protein